MKTPAHCASMNATLCYNIQTYPHAGAPTIPVPTLGSSLGKEPAFCTIVNNVKTTLHYTLTLGRLKWSNTRSWYLATNGRAITNLVESLLLESRRTVLKRDIGEACVDVVCLLVLTSFAFFPTPYSRVNRHFWKFSVGAMRRNENCVAFMIAVSHASRAQNRETHKNASKQCCSAPPVLMFFLWKWPPI